MAETLIVAGRRTAACNLLGELAEVSAPALGAVALRAALADAGIDAGRDGAIDEGIVGCVLPAGVGQAPARQALLGAGCSVSTPATTINKMCGSGMKAIMLADDAIRAGRARVIVAGGIESMSAAPHLVRGLRAGARMGDVAVQDHMFCDGLQDAYEGELMGVYAQRTADEYGFSREEMDAFAIESLRRAAAAQALENIAPVEVKTRRGTVVVDSDEQPRKSDVSKIPLMRAAFKKDGTVTAANSSSISDGAAMLILASSDWAREMREKNGAQSADGQARGGSEDTTKSPPAHIESEQARTGAAAGKPHYAAPAHDQVMQGSTRAAVSAGGRCPPPPMAVARILAQSVHAEAPARFTVAPIGAIRKVLAAAGWSAADVDLYEINEAFAAVTMAAMRDLGLPHSKVNVHGGACALGHPVGASGARIVVTLLNAMRARGARRGVAAICIGGGEATALAIERV